MKTIKIIKSVVEKLPHPASGQDFYRDETLVGFGLYAGAQSKTFYVEKRINGKSVLCNPYVVQINCYSSTFQYCELVLVFLPRHYLSGNFLPSYSIGNTCNVCGEKWLERVAPKR